MLVSNRAELIRALSRLAEPPGPDLPRLAEVLGLGPAPDVSAYTELFVHQLYPYASFYLGEAGRLGGDVREGLAGFWRVLGQEPPEEPDHLTVLLALYARLIELEAEETVAARRAGLDRACRTCLWEHLLSWLPAYLQKLSEVAPSPYRRWGKLLDETLSDQARRTPRPSAVPTALETVPPIVDPREADLDSLLTSLLAPGQSGVVLVRADLGRAARALNLGLRVGERRFILRALLSQDTAGTLAWLAEEARGWVAAHHARIPLTGAIARHWANRATTTAALLEDLSATSRSAAP